MKLDPNALDAYAKRVYEKAWKFNGEFLQLAGITQADFVGELPFERRSPEHTVCYALKPAGLGNRVLQFTYNCGFGNDPDFVVVLYVQSWHSPESNLEVFVRECGLLIKHQSEIIRIVESIPDDLPPEIVESIDEPPYKRFDIIGRPKPENSPNRRYEMRIDFVSPSQVSLPRAQALGQIEKIVAAHYTTHELQIL